MIVSFRTDVPRQTVQTQIRLVKPAHSNTVFFYWKSSDETIMKWNNNLDDET